MLLHLQILFLVVGFGSGYITAMGSSTKHFSGTPVAGRAVGVVAAGFGLSSTLVCLTYRYFGVNRLFSAWALIASAVKVVGPAVLRNPSRDGAGRRVVK